MAIIKSRKLAFIIKLVLLLPLSYITACAAAMATGGGHGNYFAILLVLGPLNVVFLMSEFKDFRLLFLGVVCLYEVYALLIRFIKSNYTLAVILTFHAASGFIAMRIAPSHFTLFDHPIIVIFLVPLALIVWMFISIDKRRKEDL